MNHRHYTREEPSASADCCAGSNRPSKTWPLLIAVAILAHAQLVERVVMLDCVRLQPFWRTKLPLQLEYLALEATVSINYSPHVTTRVAEPDYLHDPQN